MVQIKQKSNKINITALITCFMLIMVFVFGCVQFAFASDSSEKNKLLDYANAQLSRRSDYKYYIGFSYEFRTSEYSSNFTLSNIESNKVCGYVNAYNTGTSWGFLSDSSFKFDGFYGGLWFDSRYDEINKIYYCVSSSTADIVNYNYAVVSNVLTFATYDDAVNYMKTGQINNAIYKPKENVEYDSDIEVPINLDIQLNGSSDFVPNVRISCNQSEFIDNRQLEVSYSVGYRATWKLLGGVGLNIKSKTSPVVYGSIEQLDDSFDNSGTAFETIISLSKFSNSSQPDKNAFSQYEPTPKVYWSLKEIKNENSEIKIWVRNRVGNKASKWVMVSGDSYKANFDVVSSDENGNPTDLKDNSANADTGYGSDYWNNRDTTPQEDYSSTNVKTNLKDLKSNYTSLANFYKELFGFLPAEIWIILIGLVSTIVIIAIVKFVRG